MRLPDFNDFTDKNLNAISEKVKKFISDKDPKDTKEAMSLVAKINVLTVTEYLYHYHQWLSECFEQYQQDKD